MLWTRSLKQSIGGETPSGPELWLAATQVVKYLMYFNGKIMGVMSQADIFRDETMMAYEHFKTSFKVMGVVGTHSPVASLF